VLNKVQNSDRATEVELHNRHVLYSSREQQKHRLHEFLSTSLDTNKKDLEAHKRCR
jgi:hypothetical protein